MLDSHSWGSVPSSNWQKGFGEQPGIILLITGMLKLIYTWL